MPILPNPDEVNPRDGIDVKLAPGVGPATITDERIAEVTGVPLDQISEAKLNLERTGYLIDLGDSHYLVRDPAIHDPYGEPHVYTEDEKRVIRAMFFS